MNFFFFCAKNQIIQASRINRIQTSTVRFETLKTVEFVAVWKAYDSSNDI
jgi:hypothetical protein